MTRFIGYLTGSRRTRLWLFLALTLGCAAPTFSACSKINAAGQKCDMHTPPQSGLWTETWIGWDTNEPEITVLYVDGVNRQATSFFDSIGGGAVGGDCGTYSYANRYKAINTCTATNDVYSVKTKTNLPGDDVVWSNTISVSVLCD